MFKVFLFRSDYTNERISSFILTTVDERSHPVTLYLDSREVAQNKVT